MTCLHVGRRCGSYHNPFRRETLEGIVGGTIHHALFTRSVGKDKLAVPVVSFVMKYALAHK